MRRVKSLKGGIYSGWVVVAEEIEYKPYHNDSQMLLKDCGKNSRKLHDINMQVIEAFLKKHNNSPHELKKILAVKLLKPFLNQATMYEK